MSQQIVSCNQPIFNYSASSPYLTPGGNNADGRVLLVESDEVGINEVSNGVQGAEPIGQCGSLEAPSSTRIRS